MQKSPMPRFSTQTNPLPRGASARRPKGIKSSP